MAISSSEKINWQVGPSGNTPLTADNLNKINNNTADAIDAIESNVNGILSGSIPAAKATSATSDANGNTISTTYATKSSVDNIISGATTVKKAQQDASGNVITSTYCTKSEAYERANEVRTEVGNGTVVPTKVDIGTDSKIQNQLISSIFETNSATVKRATTSDKAVKVKAGWTSGQNENILTYFKDDSSGTPPTSGWSGDDAYNSKYVATLGDGALRVVTILFQRAATGRWWHYCEIPNSANFGTLISAIPSYFGFSSHDISCDNAPVCVTETTSSYERIYVRCQNDSGNVHLQLTLIFVQSNSIS